MIEFALSAPTLAAASAWVERIVPNRPHVPVLGGVVLDAADRLTLSAFDYDTSGAVTVDATVTEPGRILVSARLLAAVAKSAGKGQVAVSADQSRATVTAGKSVWRLPLLPIEDYPALPALGEAVGRMDGTLFAVTAAAVCTAAGRDQTIPMLTGVKLESAGDGALTWAATDRWRLATADTAWDGAALDVLVPVEFVEHAARVVKGHDVTVHAGGGAIGVTAGDHRLTGRLLDAQYPRWRTLVDPDPQHYADVDTAGLVLAIDQAAALGGLQLRLEVTADGIELADVGMDEGKGSRAECAADLTGEPTAVGVNPQYLRDALTAVATERVRIHLGSTPKRPLQVQPVDGEAIRYLVMPVTLSDASAAA